MAKVLDNPCYPHYCEIYRMSGISSFDPEGVKESLYVGMCRKSGSDNIRTFNTGANSTGKVDTTDYRISVPGIIKGVKKGDLVDVTDLIHTETELRIVMIESTKLGNGGTALLCNSSSN